MGLKSNARFRMWPHYLDELDRIRGIKGRTELEKRNSYKTISNLPHLQWIDIFDQPDGMTIGFLLIGTPPNCHPDADFYIEEAYIDPRFRREGRMREAAAKFISEHKGVYCLFIIDKNEPAKALWENIFTELGYEPVSLEDVGAGDEYCTQYGWAPSWDEEGDCV